MILALHPQAVGQAMERAHSANLSIRLVSRFLKMWLILMILLLLLVILLVMMFLVFLLVLVILLGMMFTRRRRTSSQGGSPSGKRLSSSRSLDGRSLATFPPTSPHIAQLIRIVVQDEIPSQSIRDYSISRLLFHELITASFQVEFKLVCSKKSFLFFRIVSSKRKTSALLFLWWRSLSILVNLSMNRLYGS